MPEYKHLKIEVKDFGPDWGGKHLRIVEQTHRGTEFGSGGFDYPYFQLVSACKPEARLNLLYLQGSDSSGDLNIVKVPSEEWLSALRSPLRSTGVQCVLLGKGYGHP